MSAERGRLSLEPLGTARGWSSRILSLGLMCTSGFPPLLAAGAGWRDLPPPPSSSPSFSVFPPHSLFPYPPFTHFPKLLLRGAWGQGERVASTLLGGCVYSGLWLGRWERKWVSTGSDLAEAGGQGFCPLMPPVRLEMASRRDTQAWVGGAAHSGNGGLSGGARLQDTGGCRLLSLTQATGP